MRLLVDANPQTMARMPWSLIVLVVVLYRSVRAQIPPGINVTAVPACAVGCLENNTDKAKGCSVTDFKCICQSTPYINAIACCIQTSCATTDQQATLEFEINVCNMYNVSIPNFIGCSPLSSSVSYADNSATSVTPTSTGILTSTVLTVTSAFTTSSGDAPAVFTGAALLTSTCTLPYIATTPLPSSSVLQFPWIGCSDQSSNCCPWQLDEQGPLTQCPLDYITTSGACCPFGWSVYSSTIAGQTPCFTSISSVLVAPSSFATNNKAITQQIFSLRYILAMPTAGLSITTQIGIGVGAGVGGLLLLGALAAFLLRRRHKAKRLQHATVFRSQYEFSQDPSPKSPYNITPFSQTMPRRNVDIPSELHSPQAVSPSGKSAKSATNWSGPSTITPGLPPMELPGSTFIHEHHPAMKMPPDEMRAGMEEKTGNWDAPYRAPYQSEERLSAQGSMHGSVQGSQQGTIEGKEG